MGQALDGGEPRGNVVLLQDQSGAPCNLLLIEYFVIEYSVDKTICIQRSNANIKSQTKNHPVNPWWLHFNVYTKMH